jgi:hypothetical protein
LSLHGPCGFDITAAATTIISCPTQLKAKYTTKKTYVKGTKSTKTHVTVRGSDFEKLAVTWPWIHYEKK